MAIKNSLKPFVKSSIESLNNWLNYHFNALAVKQRKYPENIPVFINNFNQLANLKKLVSWFQKRGFKNIIILDNNSDYPPLIEWYKKEVCKVIFLNKNLGHRAFWIAKDVREKYIKGYFILTDPDILPADECPGDFITKFIGLLYHNPHVTKVGFAIKIDDIPDSYSQKQKVLDWENKFWNNAIDTHIHLAYVDTTFALYRPNHHYKHYKFFDAIRVSGKYTCEHTSWYWDYKNLTEEQQYYTSTAGLFSEWTLRDSKTD